MRNASKASVDEPDQTQEKGTRTRRAVDGILGAEFLKRFVVEIDYETRIINLYDPATFYYKGKGDRFRLEIAHQHIFVRGRIKAPGCAAVAGRFQVDTGYATAVSLTREFVETHKLRPPADQLKRVPVCGLAGLVKDQSWEGTLERLELGRLRVEHPLTEFSQSQFNQDFDGFIGAGALKAIQSDLRLFTQRDDPGDKPQEMNSYGVSTNGLLLCCRQFPSLTWR